MLWQLIKVSKKSFIGLMSLAIWQCLAFTSLLALAERPKPPDTATPSGNTTPGTTRPEASCPKTPKPLTALVANQGQDFTLAEYPTFLVYVPYTAREISWMEFLLLNETQTKTIYQTSINLEDQPGIIQIQLSPATSKALETNTNYSWRFNLDCEPDQTIAPDLVLQGWIRRVPANTKIASQLQSNQSQKYLIYRNHSIWYDALASLAQLHFAAPEDEQLAEAWTDTLKLLKFDWLIGEPLVEAKLQ